MGVTTAETYYNNPSQWMSLENAATPALQILHIAERSCVCFPACLIMLQIWCGESMQR
jgi:hypothetical protein